MGRRLFFAEERTLDHFVEDGSKTGSLLGAVSHDAFDLFSVCERDWFSRGVGDELSNEVTGELRGIF